MVTEVQRKKCVVLKIKDCVKYIYTLNGSELQEVEKQRDLGVIINNKLTPADHIHALVSKANQRIHMIRRCFTGLNENKVTTIFKSIIRPGLEYASITWNPWLKKDKEHWKTFRTESNACLTKIFSWNRLSHVAEELI